MKRLLILICVFFIGFNSVFALEEHDYPCYENNLDHFNTYNRGILVDIDIDNLEDTSDYSYIGGFFTYKIFIKNVSNERIGGKIQVNVYNPTKQFGTGLDTFDINLEINDENILSPKYPGREKEYKVFEFTQPGTYKINVFAENDINFFRCVGNGFIHYENSIPHNFDPMPSWQKDALIDLKEMFGTVQAIKSDFNSFVEQSYQNLPLGFLSVLIAILTIILRNKRITKKSWRLFLILFSVIVVFIFSPFLIWTGIQSFWESFTLSIFLFVFGIWCLWAYIPLLWWHIHLRKRINQFEEKFENNKYCFNCHSSYYSKSPEKNYKCPFCNSEKISSSDELEEGFMPFGDFIKEKLFKSKKDK